ncbi:cache domain-containing protein [bacterium]|nr:cache domain-containing protein [bacterium]
MLAKGVMGIIAVLIATALLFAANVNYENPQTTQLVSFVERAAALVQDEGESAFPALREKGEWFHGDDYVFVWGLDGMRYVYPPDPSGEGKNMADLKDASGRPIGRMFIEKAKSPSGGWVHYQWPKPGGEKPEWKSTYIARAVTKSGDAFLVGGGKYNMPCEAAFVVEAVEDAAAVLGEFGSAAFDSMRSHASEYSFLDTYVFIKDMKGNNLFNPLHPVLEGQNIADLEDASGKHFIEEELKLLKNQDDLWFEYNWPRPTDGEPALKKVYLKKVPFGDATYVVGAGYYPKDVSEE